LRHGKDAQDGVYLQDPEGGEASRIFKSESDQINDRPTTWLPDGSAVLLWRVDSGKSSIMRLAVGGNPDSARAHPFLTSAFNLFYPRVSPNGRMLAYNSDESGQPEPFLVELRPDGSIGRPVRAGIPGGGGQRWSFDSKTLFAQDQRNRLMKVGITSAPQLSVSSPTEAFDLDKLGVAMWSVLPNGRFFVGLKNQNEGDITSYNLVLNWTEALKQKMKSPR
jgi:WD40 repeat protein